MFFLYKSEQRRKNRKIRQSINYLALKDIIKFFAITTVQKKKFRLLFLRMQEYIDFSRLLKDKFFFPD